MAFTARTRDTIRTSLLTALSVRYNNASLTLSVDVGSDAYFLADALAMELLQLEGAAEALSHEILPDEAVELLDRHAVIEGISRKAATKATHTLAVTGTPSSTLPIAAGSKLSSPGGAYYLCLDADVTTNVSGDGTISIQSIAGGSAATLAVGTILIWQSAPAGMGSQGTVTAVTVSGVDAETDDGLRKRLLDRRRQRPGSGNAEDWRDWVKQCDGVQEAWVFQRLQPGTTSGEVLGCVTIVAVGPDQEDSATNSRTLTGGRCDQIEDFINGLRDESGTLVTDGVQLRPATIATADFEVVPLTATSVTVLANTKNSARYPYPFTGTMTENSSSTATTLEVTGDQTAKNGKRVLIKVGTTYARGGYQAVTLGTGVFGGGKTVWTITTLLSTPVAASGVYPCPANWDEIQTAIFALFDSFGPRDTSALQRYPTEDVNGRATLYTSMLAATLQTVQGVVATEIDLPASDQQAAAAKGIVTLGEFLVTEL